MNAILAALVNGIVVSAVLAFVVWGALRLTPRHLLNAATRYAIWWAVLVATICLPLSYFGAGRTKPAVVSPISMAAAPPVQIGITPAAEPSLPLAVPAKTLPPGRRDIPWIHFPLTIPASMWPARILAIWLFSAALMLVRLIASAIILERRKERASEPSPALAARVTHWVATCGGSTRRIQLNVSREISVPLVSGPWNASILLPERLLGELSEQDLEQIGIHEAAHLVRYDDYALSTQRIIQALFALHPVVHWISRRIDLEREIACDDFVIAANGNPKPYAACLARVVQLSGGIRATPVAAAAVEDNSHLAKRVEMLLDGTRNAGTGLLSGRLVAVTLCIAALTFGASQIPHPLDFAGRSAPATAVLIVHTPAAPLLIAQANRAPAQSPTLLPPETPRAPIHVDTRLVLLNVTVTDGEGNPVSNLTQSDFQVLENNVAQPIRVFTHEDVPVSMALVVDSSGSMRNKRQGVENALLALVRDSNPQDESFVVNFNDQAWLDADFTSDPAVLKAGLERADARGGTAMWDAMQMSLDHLRDNAKRPRKVIVVITDGVDNASKVTVKSVASRFQEDGTLVYFITLPEHPGSPVSVKEAMAETMDRAVKQLAEITGGEAYFPKNENELTAVTRALSQEIRNQYTLMYAPPNQTGDDSFRNINVTVTAPGNPLVRTRQGYRATKEATTR